MPLGSRKISIGVEALELGDGEGVDGCGDGVPVGGVGEGEGEVALDGLEAGEIVGGDVLSGQRVERGEIELGEVDGLAEFAALGSAVESSPKWAMGLLLRSAVALRPGWSHDGGFGGEGEGGWASGEGEEGDHGFDCAFELEDGGVLWRCGAAWCGGAVGEAEGELGDSWTSAMKLPSADGAGEDVALLEEADVFDVAVEVVGEHGDHAGDERRAEERGFFGERVFHGTVRCSAVAKRSAVGLAGEGAGDGFGEAEGEEAGADGGFGGGGGVGDDDAGGGEGVGEAVVAVDAGDLFDEVDLALEVEAPGGELDGEGCRLLAAGCGWS